ncbi:MAG TPA: hypothetical protein VLJ80_15615 [Solirubrobacteraceae bacterium]|nr:hypothetical protein [Solirubrobacteraceae bacterium]
MKFRWLCIVTCCTVALGASASVASAAGNFQWYWFNGGTQNCWQTGQLGSPASGCDNLSEHFLEVPGRLLNGGIGQNVELNPSGDYCSYYGLSDTPNKQDSVYEGGFTGLGTPLPYGGYQEWDGHGNVCQAWEQFMGHGLRRSYCSTTTCGMHHYVSLHEQGYSDRPWSTVFSNPEFVISAQAIAQTITPSSTAGWGYLCPVFQDAQPPHDILEYCLQEWRGAGNSKDWESEGVATCAYGPASNAIDTVITLFWPTTTLATNLGATTGVDPSGWKTYSAKITEANLKTAIELDRRPFKQKPGGNGEASPEHGYGCGRASELSTSPAEYALIGIEQGAEGWSFEKLGVAGGSIYAHTEYTPRAPEATTSGSSNVQEEQVTLNGTVNPRGTDTHYYFQYGETTSYGSATSEADAGSGLSGRAVSATISELQPGDTYHYRLVAVNNVGQTVYGTDQSATATSKPATIFDAAGGLWVLTEGPNNSLNLTVKSTNGTWSGPYQVEGPGTTYSEPSIAFDSAGALWVLAEGPNHSMNLTVKSSTGTWSGPYQVEGSGTTYSAPTIRFDSAGVLWAAAQGPNNSMYLTVKSSTGTWSGPYQVEGSGTTYSAPAELFDSAGVLWVLAEGPNKSMSLTVKQGAAGNGAWSGPYQVEGSSTTYSASNEAFDSGGTLWVLAEGPSKSMYLTLKSGSNGSWYGPYQVEGSGTTASPSPEAFDSAGNLWALAQNPSNGLSLTLKQSSTGSWLGPYQEGPSGSTYSAPSELFDSAGTLWALYVGPSNSLNMTLKSGTNGEWLGPYQVGGSGTAFSKVKRGVRHEHVQHLQLQSVSAARRALEGIKAAPHGIAARASGRVVPPILPPRLMGPVPGMR